MECAWQCFPPSPLKVLKLFISGAEMGDGSLRAGAARPDHLCFNYWEVQKASAEQEGRVDAFLLPLTFLFSSPCPGSVTFPCPSVSKGMQCCDCFNPSFPILPCCLQPQQHIRAGGSFTGTCVGFGRAAFPTQALSSPSQAFCGAQLGPPCPGWVTHQGTPSLAQGQGHLGEAPRASGTAVIQPGKGDLQIILRHSLEQLIS